MKRFYLAAIGLLVMFAVSAQNVETADLHQPVNVNDAVVTGGVLRTQVLRDSLIMNSETGQMEKTPVVVDYLDVPVRGSDRGRQGCPSFGDAPCQCLQQPGL